MNDQYIVIHEWEQNTFRCVYVNVIFRKLTIVEMKITNLSQDNYFTVSDHTNFTESGLENVYMYKFFLTVFRFKSIKVSFSMISFNTNIQPYVGCV